MCYNILVERLEKQLKEAILNSGMSQSELADKSGVNQGQISYFLAEGNKHRGLTLKSASKIAKVLKLELKKRKRANL